MKQLEKDFLKWHWNWDRTELQKHCRHLGRERHSSLWSLTEAPHQVRIKNVGQGPGVKSTCCSCWGPRINSQHPHHSTYKHLQLQLQGTPTASSDLLRVPTHAHRYIHLCERRLPLIGGVTQWLWSWGPEAMLFPLSTLRERRSFSIAIWQKLSNMAVNTTVS